jgi:hypothetical protein
MPAHFNRKEHVMTDKPTNADCAEWAKDALAAFTGRHPSGDCPDTMHCDGLECSISELVCGLMHYAQRQALDTGSIPLQACGLSHLKCLRRRVNPDETFRLTLC